MSPSLLFHRFGKKSFVRSSAIASAVGGAADTDHPCNYNHHNHHNNNNNNNNKDDAILLVVTSRNDKDRKEGTSTAQVTIRWMYQQGRNCVASHVITRTATAATLFLVVVVPMIVVIVLLYRWNQSHIDDGKEAPFDHWYSTLQKPLYYGSCPQFQPMSHNNHIDDDSNDTTTTTYDDDVTIPWYMISARQPYNSTVKPLFDAWKQEFPTMQLISTDQMSHNVFRRPTLYSNTTTTRRWFANCVDVMEDSTATTTTTTTTSTDIQSNEEKTTSLLRWKTRLFAVYVQVFQHILSERQRTISSITTTSHTEVSLPTHFGLIEDDVVLINAPQIRLETFWIMQQYQQQQQQRRGNNNNNTDTTTLTMFDYYSFYKTTSLSSSSCLYDHGSPANLFSYKFIEYVIAQVSKEFDQPLPSPPTTTTTTSTSTQLYITDPLPTVVTTTGSTNKYCRMPIDMYIAHLGPWYVTRQHVVQHIGKRYTPPNNHDHT